MSRKQWINASYLIGAKKDIDSLLYLNEHFDSIPKIGIKEFYDSKRADFYLKLVILIDKCFDKRKKSDLRNKDKTIATILDYRNKYFAHKDYDFILPDHVSRESITDEMMRHIQCVKTCCTEYLPTEITLDYIAHDRLLFRLLHGIDKKKEEEIERIKYPERIEKPTFTMPAIKAFNDVEDIRKISSSDINKYGVGTENGINFNEGLQNRQDFCIRCNVLFETNIWPRFNMKSLNAFTKLHELGVVNDYDIPNFDDIDEENLEKIRAIFKEAEQ